MAQRYKVLAIIFEGFNTLDLNGPLDVFTKSGMSKHFTFDIASETDITTSTEKLMVKRHLCLDDELIANASKDYDILCVAGGATKNVDAMIKDAKFKDTKFAKMLTTFASTSPQGSRPRILLSICTAALFLGTLGIFNTAVGCNDQPRLCTSHWGVLNQLADQNEASSKQASPRTIPGTVVRSRFVDGGNNTAGVQIISSGGISCGMDASLYVVKQLVDAKQATGINTWKSLVGKKGDEIEIDKIDVKKLVELVQGLESVPESVEICMTLDYAWHQTEGMAMLANNVTKANGAASPSGHTGRDAGFVVKGKRYI